MITKEEAINKLKKAGYNVVDEDSVITIIISEKASIKNTVKNVKELFLKIDYQASFGVKQHSGASDESAGESEGNQTDEFDAEDIDEYASNEDEIMVGDFAEENEEAVETVSANEKPVKKTGGTAKGSKKATTVKKTSDTKKSSKAKESDSDNDEFFDDEDEALDDVSTIKLDDLDMDMMLNEDSVQFSLEDFGLF